MRLVAAAGVAAGVSTLHAQDMEPRAFSNSPTGLSFLLAGYTYAKGSVLTDPSLPLDNAKFESHTEILAFATTLNVFGKSSKIDVVVPYSSLSGEADLTVSSISPAGQPAVTTVHRERFVYGFGDPTIRFSINFIGAPALTMKEFASYKQNLIVGASLRIGIPLGQYDDTKILNIGSNRWSFKPELGFSKAFGPCTIEVAPGVVFYTNNGDYVYGHTRAQAPLFSLQGNVSYSFAPSCWLAVNATYFNGARSTVDNVPNDDNLEGVRVGVTLALPVNRHNSIKLYANTGWNSYGDHVFDSLGVVWQYRWGGGF